MNRTHYWIDGICFVANLTLIGVALHSWGAREVRSDMGELFFLTLCGAFWLGMAAGLFEWLGLSFRDDVEERGNVAALLALCSALTAVSVIYAGANVGEWPDYWPNLFCTILGTSSFFVFWIILELGASVSMSIAEERDLASGLRMGGFALATGLFIGRAVAGDWHSEAETIRDFVRDGWPATALCVSAVFVERHARPSRRRPFPAWPRYGLLPALVYVGLASAWLWHLGPWQGIPR